MIPIVIEFSELTKESLREILEQVYNDGYQRGIRDAAPSPTPVDFHTFQYPNRVSSYTVAGGYEPNYNNPTGETE